MAQVQLVAEEAASANEQEVGQALSCCNGRNS